MDKLFNIIDYFENPYLGDYYSTAVWEPFKIQDLFSMNEVNKNLRFYKMQA